MKIVVFGAFLDELVEIKKRFDRLKEVEIAKRKCLTTQFEGHDILISLSGVGTSSSASTTTAICEVFGPDLIILCGVAGGLESTHKIGDLVLADKIIDIDLYDLRSICEGTPYEANCLTDPHTLKPVNNEYTVHPVLQELGASLSIERLNKGTIVTSNIFPAPKSLFPKIKDLKCSAIEMESAGVFKAAEYYDVPVMTIRAISNLLNNCGDDLGTENNALQICAERLSLFVTEFFKHLPELDTIFRSAGQKEIIQLIEKHNLSQHPEGGWYCQTFRSQDLVKAQGSSLARYSGESRVAGTSIIYLLTQGDYSGWHSVKSDETWNFHSGDPLLLRVIDTNSGELTEVLLGLTNECKLQHTVKSGFIFSAESLGQYSLTGCMVTPGFEFKDFHLITMTEFLNKFSQHSSLKRLVREKAVVDISEKVKTVQFFTETLCSEQTTDETENCSVTM